MTFLALALVCPAKATDPSTAKGAPSACDPASNAKEVAEAREGIKQYQKFLDVLKSSGLPVPPTLQALGNKFGESVEMGVDLAEAAGQVEFELQEIRKNKYSLCAQFDDNEDGVCWAKVDRLWQARNVEAVLSSNPGSVVRRAVSKWLGNTCRKTFDPYGSPLGKEGWYDGSK
ncbi:hypothetical protein NKH95_17570 [Mesorhizobium sp. M0848]|uniref:hypothetical protein n=1 Tax=Mesorhizobium sp. M0848 TaxID=2957012 RepID=UPI0033352529